MAIIPPLVQIATGGGWGSTIQIFGLDNTGRVWEYNQAKKVWVLIPDTEG
jgi:hypothetical protein